LPVLREGDVTLDERNKAIAAAFKAGETRNALAKRYGLTPRRISQIAAAHGVHRYDADQVAMGLRFRGGRPRDPKLAALNSEDRRFYTKLMQSFGAAYARQALGLQRGGRQVVLATDPERRADYLKLRDAYGAAYAREAMGLAA
jgi:hypothetical protein